MLAATVFTLYAVHDDTGKVHLLFRVILQIWLCWYW